MYTLDCSICVPTELGMGWGGAGGGGEVMGEIALPVRSELPAAL